ncbi:MAG: hypothetical protein J6D12_01795 [Peptostreptococcaceae bacterium]|nr:hypothetical protein [Peptostreptococcaceae bacterium]
MFINHELLAYFARVDEQVILDAIKEYGKVINLKRINTKDYWIFNNKTNKYDITSDGCELICSHLTCILDKFEYYEVLYRCFSTIIDQQQEQIKEFNGLLNVSLKNKEVYDLEFIAKILQTYNKNLDLDGLYNYLKFNNIIINSNISYSTYDEYFVLKINKIELGTRDRIETKLAFNHKGVKWLVNKLIKDGLLDRNVGILKLL